jgi:hypothetical protein
VAIVTPSGARVPIGDEPVPLTLDEPGFYDLRAADRAQSTPLFAANVDVAESDLAGLDPAELVAAATAGGAADAAAAEAAAGPADRERQQALWWYLVMAGLAVLLGETVLSNRLPRTIA